MVIYEKKTPVIGLNNVVKVIVFLYLYIIQKEYKLNMGICNYTDDLVKPLSLDLNQFHIWKIRCGISHLF